MKKTLIVTLTLLMASPVYAHPPHRDHCGKGGHCDRHYHKHGRDHHRHHDDHRRDRGRALTPAELRFLPPLPPHQRYRVVDNQVVRMDEKTMAIVAVLGLLTTLMATR
ncbi:hypothetical protein [Falsirhodobacter halotolerans]|uniref:hypothetical protein n=1 Tax=Falsirhodobacter halotolerans TaxID=1146892 RepID=UPI001FD429BB|nr:hypothetical protein [Falsirhodobacter halotolerans]MCJ8139073.1 hypothetical protein [Falsirhodobacter halotolerans]